MKTRTSCNCSGRVQRGAFTLVELLVVITIMAALMALTASAVLKFVGVQQSSNTQSTLDRVQSQLARAWSKVKDQAKNEPIPPAVMALAGTDANAANRARYIYVKLKLRQAFPMNFAEALNTPYLNPEVAVWLNLPPTTPIPASPLPPLPGYVTYLASLGIKSVALGGTVGGPTYVPQPYESSACLLMALQRGVAGAGIDPEALTAGGAAGSFPAPLGNLPYLNDAWNRPIFFSRVPSGNFYLNPLGAMTGPNDPGDPQGLLLTPQWVWVGGLPTNGYSPLWCIPFTQLTLQQPPPPVLPTTSFKLAPLVASGGETNWSKLGGIIPPFDPITFATVPGSGALFSTPQ